MIVLERIETPLYFPEKTMSDNNVNFFYVV